MLHLSPPYRILIARFFAIILAPTPVFILLGDNYWSAIKQVRLRPLNALLFVLSSF